MYFILQATEKRKLQKFISQDTAKQKHNKKGPSFHFKGQTYEFYPQDKKVELHYMNQAVKEFKNEGYIKASKIWILWQEIKNLFL